MPLAGGKRFLWGFQRQNTGRWGAENAAVATGGQPAYPGRLFFLKPFGDNPISRLSLRSQLLSSSSPTISFLASLSASRHG